MYYKYNLEYNIKNNDVFPEIGQPIMPSTYILTPFVYEKNNIEQNQLFNIVKTFKVKGYNKYILPVFEEIYNNWFGNIKDLVSFYKKEIEDLKDNLDISESDKTEKMLKFSLLEREANHQKSNKSSIETKIEKIVNIHKYEETIIIALWKELTKYENLPTSKLSNMKYENFILWYALTCIGDIVGPNKDDISVIGRPFDYNAGMPITIMYELEKTIAEEDKNNLKKIEID